MRMRIRCRASFTCVRSRYAARISSANKKFVQNGKTQKKNRIKRRRTDFAVDHIEPLAYHLNIRPLLLEFHFTIRIRSLEDLRLDVGERDAENIDVVQERFVIGLRGDAEDRMFRGVVQEGQDPIERYRLGVYILG